MSVGKNILYGLVLATLLLLVAEGLARLLLPFPVGTRHTYASDPQVLYFHRPNSVGYEIAVHGDFQPTQVKYNNLGFRGDLEKIPTDKPLVVVLGDSFVEARQVGESTSVTGLLEHRFPGLFFVNAGCSAYTTTTEYLLLKHRLLELKPKRLVLFFSFNDYADNFNYQGGYYRHNQIFTGDSPPAELRPQDYESAQATTFVDAVKVHSALAANLARILATPPKVQLAIPVDRHQFQESFLGVNTPTELLNDTGLEVLSFTHRGLAEIAHLTKENNIDLSVFIIPLPMQVDANEWSPGKTEYYGLVSESVEPSTQYQTRLLQFCKATGIRCVDLLPEFRRASSSGNRLFLPYDGHFSRRGHEVATSVVSRAISGEI